MPGAHGVHGAHVRSATGPHGDDSNVPSAHGVEHAAHAVSVNDEQGAVANWVESHVVQVAHVVPLPVKPGAHVHCTKPPRSAQAAWGLQPPLSTAHAPIPAGTQKPPMHESPVPQRMPHAPQSRLSLSSSTQPSAQATSGSPHETYAGCAHATSVEQARTNAHQRTSASVSHPIAITAAAACYRGG